MTYNMQMNLPSVRFPLLSEKFSLTSNQAQAHIKMLFINHTGNLAGAERSLLGLISNLKKRGIICKVILPHPGLMEDKLNQLGIKYSIISYEWWAHAAKDLKVAPHVVSANNQAIIDIANQIKQFNPDLVYTNTMVVPWGAMAAKLTGKPHIWSIREFGNKDHSLEFDLGYKQTLKMIDNLSTAVFVNSKAVQKEVCKIIPKSKVSLFYNYITLDPKLISQPVTKDAKVFNLLIAGSILPNKGQFEAVKALNYLKNYPVHLTIVGPVTNKDYFRRIKRFIKDQDLKNKVTLLDFTDNPYLLMKQSDAILICSRNEAFGRTTVEAMLLKKLVIGTRSGGTVEQIKDGQNGLLYTPGKPIELAQKIAYLIDHPKLAKKMAKLGYKGVKENFTIQKCIDSLVRELYRIKASYIPAIPAITFLPVNAA